MAKSYTIKHILSSLEATLQRRASLIKDESIIANRYGRPYYLYQIQQLDRSVSFWKNKLEEFGHAPVWEVSFKYLPIETSPTGSLAKEGKGLLVNVEEHEIIDYLRAQAKKYKMQIIEQTIELKRIPTGMGPLN